MEETEACADRLRDTLAAIDDCRVTPPVLLEKLARLSRALGQVLGEELVPSLEDALARLDEMAVLIEEARDDAARLIEDLQAGDEGE